MFNSKKLLVIIFVSISVTIIALAIGQQRIAIAYLKPAAEEIAEAPASNKQSSAQQLGNIVATVSVGDAPIGIAVNPNTNMIYVVNQLSNTASVIDGKTNAVVKSTAVGKGLISIAINPNTNMLYQANPGAGTVSMIMTKFQSLR